MYEDNTVDVTEIKEYLRYVLNAKDVFIEAPWGNNTGDYDPNLDGESEAHKIIRYLIYWREFGPDLPALQFEWISARYQLKLRMKDIERLYGATGEEIERAIEYGLDAVSGKIASLLREHDLT